MAINVLVVDDSKMMRKHVIRTLKTCSLPWGEVSEAGNGQDGLEALERQRIDIVFIDIHMPVMDGDQMFDAMRKDLRFLELPVIFVSSESSASRIEMLLKLGASFVHKPFLAEHIEETVMALLGGPCVA